MNIFKRILAGLGLLLGTVGLLLSLAGGIGVWIVKESVTTKATYAFQRIDSKLDIAEKGLEQVQTSLTRAQERMETAREEQRNLAQRPRSSFDLRRPLLNMVQRSIAPDLDNAHATFHKVAEASLVVNTVLEDLGNSPFVSLTGLDADSLSDINARLSQVESSAWALGRLLTEPDLDSDAAGAQLTQVEQTLKSLQELIARYQTQVKQLRERTTELKSRTLYWIPIGTFLISFVCFWIALSQISILIHAWSWMKPANKTSPRA